MRVGCGGLGGSIVVLLGAASVALAAEPADEDDGPDGATPVSERAAMGDEPEGGYGGYGVRRTESEFSIHVPAGVVEDVWKYLSSAYGPGGKLPAGIDPGRYSARLGDERFVDRYYDTPELTLLAGQNGVRYRSRVIPGVPEDPKNDRHLVQIKVTTGTDTITRGEYKYPVRSRGASVRDDRDTHPVLGLVRRRYRKAFVEQVKALGVDAWKLDEVVRLDQRRRRVYIGDQEGMLLTVTLDEVTAQRWWVRAPWTELEIEINEIRYSGADAAERKRMEDLRAAARSDLLGRFPLLLEDDQPKYNEAFAHVEEKLPLMRRAIAAREGLPPWLTFGLAGVMVAGSAVVIARRHRGGRTAGP